MRHSDLKFRGDNIGDLIFNGTSSNIDKSSLNSGVQADFSKKINDKILSHRKQITLLSNTLQVVSEKQNFQDFKKSYFFKILNHYARFYQ